MNDRLYRSRDDRVIGGVCAGLAERMDLDPALVRVGWVILTILTGGVLILLYIVMLFVVPEEPIAGAAWTQPPPQPGAVPGWTPPAAGTAWTGQAGSMPGDAAGGWAGAGAAGTSGAVGTSGAAGTSGATTPTPPPSAGAPETPATGWTPPGATPPTAWTSPMDARAARRAARRERRAQADPMVGLVFGAILVLIGLFFLGRQYVPELDFDRIWPVVVILIGALLVARAFYRPRPGA